MYSPPVPLRIAKDARTQVVRTSGAAGVVAEVEILPRINRVRPARLVEHTGADVADVFVGIDRQRPGSAEVVGAARTGERANVEEPGRRGDRVRAGRVIERAVAV